ncbi:biopolymer transporter ExbD [Parahaliea sp. F7430]|uniref:Biopolymer transporter ExbD n=1 Tax=Sediminihaliea albiluteola TaxID=2758564 RepID=A0A7W2YI71_9GAMM|nr:biopolymer transporter ExbD [Sediminihaliea albiluteola]MBA6411740.1 biopolymer transporter ExbD [Sediminihaliea albiluteola]
MEIAGLYQHKARKISLTALIDVVFILLMFFMLTSSFNQWNAIELQATATNTNNVELKPQILLLSSEGAIQSSDGSVELPASQAVPANAFARDRLLILLAAPEAQVQVIVTRLEELKKHGLRVTMGGISTASSSVKALEL